MSRTEVTVGAGTRFVGVIGDPVDHSLSPALHNAAYRALGLDYCYGAFAVAEPDTKAAIDGARVLGFVGLSVTTPHKKDAARYSDQKSHVVELLGVANTIVYAAGVAIAHSTDGEGLVRDLAENCGVDISESVFAVLGAGGAARAVVAGLAEAGAPEVLVINRTPSRAAELVALFGVARVANAEETPAAAVVINATSLGLSAPGLDAARDAAARELAAEVVEGQLVIDLAYRYEESAFLQAAKSRGARVRNGLGMLVHQAASQVELFTGCPAPTKVMWEAVGGDRARIQRADQEGR